MNIMLENEKDSVLIEYNGEVIGNCITPGCDTPAMWSITHQTKKKMCSKCVKVYLAVFVDLGIIK